ncbi:hypothetical protein FHS61_000417 [Altererythrobacter atlanticus]|uniref:Uncharacterized protein n=1 Tax=Croceibacterium atlanticum TaxID=1267766 RepID=A0A0F7KTS6_9SPHN|nr:DUF4350 domain-containing protein [Croceibacterium atlanticum]AKH42647.1 hypothetical protein WYH_01611 [Croceibacterium atlanticum]MBB5731424.1 hypothetical protein [Croceibacterium atlanticum]
MSRAAGPFPMRAVLGLIVGGGAVFLLLLYAMAQGWDGGRDDNGGAHAAANGLNGFSALAGLLERRGHEVSLSRSRARLEDDSLLVITPQHSSDAEDLEELIEGRRYIGPTLVILPKWLAGPVPREADTDTGPGWVQLAGAMPPSWAKDFGPLGQEPAIEQFASWRGLGLEGTLPVPGKAQAINSSAIAPLVENELRRTFAGYWDNGGYYPILSELAGERPLSDEEVAELDQDAWPVVIVVEPDLMNNYGLSDPARAELAVRLVEATLEDYDLPIVFDLTIAGLGRAENLLTLAFTPPFLAATLCLILATLLIGWRGFRRFGPPIAEAPAQARGKRQLARNGAALVERARRLHLLGPPYAAMIGRRIARDLGIRATDPLAREQAIENMLQRRGMADTNYVAQAEALRRARKPGELLRAAAALRTIERTLEQ